MLMFGRPRRIKTEGWVAYWWRNHRWRRTRRAQRSCLPFNATLLRCAPYSLLGLSPPCVCSVLQEPKLPKRHLARLQTAIMVPFILNAAPASQRTQFNTSLWRSEGLGGGSSEGEALYVRLPLLGLRERRRRTRNIVRGDRRSNLCGESE